MTTMLVLFVLAVGSEATETKAAPAATEAKLRPYHEYDKAIDEALRTEVRAANQHERAEAIRRITGLYRELLRDPRLENSDTLKGFKATLWSRLNRVKGDLKRQLERDAKLAKREPETQAAQQAARSLSDQVSMMNYTMGGPGYVLSQTGGALGGGMMEDHGQELVDLIERTIRPDFWETAGGPGSIFYFKPLMAIVVRATDEVHGSVAGLVDGLRRASN